MYFVNLMKLWRDFVNIFIILLGIIFLLIIFIFVLLKMNVWENEKY